MSRRDKKPLAKRTSGDRRGGARPSRGPEGERPGRPRSGGKPPLGNKPPRLAASAPRAPRPAPEQKPAREAEALLPTKVQTVVVTADENNMRVDRFLEARFPGLSFSHIQRIVRKGELRVIGKGTASNDS